MRLRERDKCFRERGRERKTDRQTEIKKVVGHITPHSTFGLL